MASVLGRIAEHPAHCLEGCGSFRFHLASATTRTGDFAVQQHLDVEPGAGLCVSFGCDSDSWETGRPDFARSLATPISGPWGSPRAGPGRSPVRGHSSRIRSHPSYPRSRNTAPASASNASARLVRRTGPPDSNSPRPMTRCSPSPRRAAALAKCLAPDGVRAPCRQFSLRRLLRAFVHGPGHDEVDYAVAEELQSFI